MKTDELFNISKEQVNAKVASSRHPSVVYGLANCRRWLGTALAVVKEFNMYKIEICFVFFLLGKS